MEVRPETVVSFEYVLRVDGRVVDASPRGDPVTILYGHSPALPSGLEGILVGLAPGPFQVVVPPELAAGPHDPEKVMTVDRGEFPTGAVMEVGEEFYAQDENGTPITAQIVAIEGGRVTVDTNPEFAGKTLEYTGVIHGIREAAPEEIKHGHAHGDDGICR